MRQPIRHRFERSGTTLVELSLMLTFVLMLLFGIMEYGRLFMTRNIMDNAARDGVRFAVVHTSDKTTANVQAQVDSFMAVASNQLQGYTPTSSIQVYQADSVTGANIGPWTNAGFGQYIGVQVSGKYTPIVPLLLKMTTASDGTITLTSQAVMYCEAN